MKRLVFLLMFLLMAVENGVAWAGESIHFGPFGDVSIYRTSPHPSHVVLFVSGDGGWNSGVVDMAKALSRLDTLVLGIDITHYMMALEQGGDECSYPAADFEMLSKAVQKKLQFPRYVSPLLVGYSSGATLAYATLVQAPPNTFLGAMSLGFCPDLRLRKPLCHGYGLEWKALPKGKGYTFLPAEHLPSPWIAFQGLIDQVCDPAATEAFVREVQGAEIVTLPKVGHGFAVQRNWMPQFKQTFLTLATGKKGPSETNLLTDLPLVVVPAKAPSASMFAVIISGDGGWAGIDRQVAQVLSEHGVPVVGLNSLHYFWNRKTPKETGRDLERILSRYSRAWSKDKVLIIGYSLGADVLPFMATRLPPHLLRQVHCIALLGPSQKAAFEFHLSDWLGPGKQEDSLPVFPEVEKLRGMKILCFCGEKESGSLCKSMDPGLAKVFVLPGAHHFGGHYRFIAETILKEATALQK